MKTREELLAYFYQLTEPLEKYRDPAEGRLHLGSSATHYDRGQIDAEGFLRLLWGVGPLAGSGVITEKQFEYYKNAILHSVDKTDSAYWGEIQDYDQLIVEMAALAVTLIETKTIFWDKLVESEKMNLITYLNRLNEVAIHENNWRFFRILSNVALYKLGHPLNQEKMTEDLTLIDHFYLEEGWYFDGSKTQQDYYIPWAFHYYGLLYAYYMMDEDPKRAAVFRTRATEFAQSFKFWFDQESGAGVPFGRSLIYRFAQCAFWSVCAFTQTEVLPWSEIKYLIMKHFGYWKEQEIQKADGVLSIGYAYENHTMAERYNGPGSPYWSYKAFIVLALPKEHPFWRIKPTKPSLAKCLEKIQAANMLLTNEQGTNIQLYPTGQYSPQAHSDDKYSKFVYSSLFGFSVSKGNHDAMQKANDNILAVSEQGSSYFVTKEAVIDQEVTEYYTKQSWEPFPQTKIISWIVPLGDWHVRIHRILNERAIVVSDGGFSNKTFNSHPHNYPIKKHLGAIYHESSLGVTATVAYYGYETVTSVFPDPNTNLLFPNTVFDACEGNLLVGEHWLISAHYGSQKLFTAIPQVILSENQVTITYNEQTQTILVG